MLFCPSGTLVISIRCRSLPRLFVTNARRASTVSAAWRQSTPVDPGCSTVVTPWSCGPLPLLTDQLRDPFAPWTRRFALCNPMPTPRNRAKTAPGNGEGALCPPPFPAPLTDASCMRLHDLQLKFLLSHGSGLQTPSPKLLCRRISDSHRTYRCGRRRPLGFPTTFHRAWLLFVVPAQSPREVARSMSCCVLR